MSTVGVKIRLGHCKKFLFTEQAACDQCEGDMLAPACRGPKRLLSILILMTLSSSKHDVHFLV